MSDLSAVQEFLARPVIYARPEWLPESTWHLHVPFAFGLVDLLRPRLFVELGTQKGLSYCAFCQAAETLGHDMRAVAVDHWQGDEHTGAYARDTLQVLRDHHDPRYAGFSTLKQALFDEAVADFEHGSIDLLHIDGLHTYEAVRHDFETWLPKMSRRGVMLFHDTEIRDRDFGVWKLWAELSGRYPSLNFPFGCGLGVLLVGPEVPSGLRRLTGMDADAADLLFRACEALGERALLAHQRDMTAAQLEDALQRETYLNEVFARYRSDSEAHFARYRSGSEEQIAAAIRQYENYRAGSDQQLAEAMRQIEIWRRAAEEYRAIAEQRLAQPS